MYFQPHNPPPTPAPITSSSSMNNNQQLSAGAGSNPLSNTDTTPMLNEEKIEQLIFDILNIEKREKALLELSKGIELYPDLVPVIWFSFGTIAALLQEIVSVYPQLSPPTLKKSASDRVCNSLALLHSVASHPQTRQLFLNAQIPLFLYPFLNTVCKERPFGDLRLTSLGVIGALVKVDDPHVIDFLLQTEIIPLCLRIMENGCNLSKTVATFIIQKILADEQGLKYICATAERFYAVSEVLNGLVAKLADRLDLKLVKHILRCYLRLCDNARAEEALKQCFPTILKDPRFQNCLKEDQVASTLHAKFLRKLCDPSAATIPHLSNLAMPHGLQMTASSPATPKSLAYTRAANPNSNGNTITRQPMLNMQNNSSYAAIGRHKVP